MFDVTQIMSFHHVVVKNATTFKEKMSAMRRRTVLNWLRLMSLLNKCHRVQVSCIDRKLLKKQILNTYAVPPKAI